MTSDLKIDQLLDKVDSRYGLVMAAAKRARQINEYTATLGLNESLGIPGPQVHTRSQHPLGIAIEELRSGKLEVSFRSEEPAEEPAEIEEVASDEAAALAQAEADGGGEDQGAA